MSLPRKVAFVVASTNHGTFIVNRLDYRMTTETAGYGVGFSLLETANYVQDEADGIKMLLNLRRQYAGDGVVAVDCGANIGAFAVQWANAMTGWGSVIAIEPQERIFYALAGNIVINNCTNARAIHAAAGSQTGTLRVPMPDYQKSGSYGSLELRQTPATEFIGQPIDYAEANLTTVPMISIDWLALTRLDLLKIDVERMELEVLEGAKETIQRHKPVILIECVKTAPDEIIAVLASHDYCWFPFGQNFLSVHSSDPVRQHLSNPP